MADEGKKISFSFSKSIKKHILKNAPPKEEKKVDYIECIDKTKIKVINEPEQKDETLVIPMLGSKTWHDRIINKVNADIYEKINDEVTNGENTVQPMDTVTIKIEEPEIKQKPLTLEEQAAKELMQDIQSTATKEKNESLLTVSCTEGESLLGQEESTLENYEEIPVNGFGLAMLRGMGWQPGKGLGKSGKIVETALPELRPMGLGLGADKVTLQNETRTKEEEQLKFEKGSFVKIIAGKEHDNYGEITGFDDEAGRLIIKMALGGHTVSVYESMVHLVTKNEFSNNAKVLNAKKFEKYTNNEVVIIESSSESDEKHGSKSEKSKERCKKTKKHRHRSNDSDSDSDQESRRRRSSSLEEKLRKSKKSKKHKKRGSSSERLSKKNRKKDKERERTRDRRTEYSDSLDRRRKKHKRSRSRSSNRR